MTGLLIALGVIVTLFVLIGVLWRVLAWVAPIETNQPVPASARLGHRMSPTVALTMARYRPFWTDQLAEAIVARKDAATAQPFNSFAYLIAQGHVAALSRIIVALERS